jgi:hypothetical protein
MYLCFLDCFIKMCLMMVRVNRNTYHSAIYHESVVLDSICGLQYLYRHMNALLVQIDGL